MKALVTGAAGFIGSNITKRLLDDSWEVVGVDSFTDYYDPQLKRQNVASLPPGRLDFVESDLLTIDANKLLEDIDVVFHQAGQPGVRKSWGTDFAVYVDANVAVTQRLLEAAKTAPHLKKFVYASSSSIYGDAARFPVSEEDAPRPMSPYGVTKLAAEHLCTLYAKNFGVPSVSLRYFTVYGPGQRPDMAFTRFVRAALLDDEITIFGDGEQIRDFTFISDIVEANLRAALAETVPGAVFNVAGGSNISVNDSLAMLTSLAGRSLNVKYIDAVPGDVARTGASTEAFRNAVGWAPSVTTEQGLAAQFEWGRKVFGMIGQQ